MIELYSYQQALFDKVKNFFASGVKSVIAQLPTGGGKTVIFSYMAQQASSRGKKVLIVSHRVELLTQAGGTLSEFGMQPQLITAKTKVPRDTPVSVAMAKTLQNRLKSPIWHNWFNKLDLVIIDECHRSEFYFLKELNCYKLGVTATPKRSGKMPQLSEEYNIIAEGPDVQELINMGKLMPDKHYGVPIDLTGVGKGADGDFNANQMFNAFNKPKLYTGLIDNWKKYANKTVSICFCCNIQHAIETTKSLNSAGISAKFVTSRPSKPKEPDSANAAAITLYNRRIAEYENYLASFDEYSGDRDDIVSRWKSGEFYVIVNAGIFVEGFDHKPTQTVILNLATTSENKYLQMIGRGSRPSPDTGKTHFIILDFGENADRLGYYRQQREYSLHHTSNSGDGVPPSKECPKCLSLVFTSAVICKYCGYEWPKSKQEEIAELVHREYTPMPYKEIDFRSMTTQELEEYAKQTGKKKAWVWRTIYFSADDEKEGEKALKSYAKKNGYHWSWVKRQINLYRKK